MSKLYYFAHPYSGNPEENFRLANERTVKLIDAGWQIFSPIGHGHPIQVIKDRPCSEWMNLNYVIMSRCDGLILAPEWQKSKGCVLEREWFAKRGLPILEYDGLML